MFPEYKQVLLEMLLALQNCQFAQNDFNAE